MIKNIIGYTCFKLCSKYLAWHNNVALESIYEKIQNLKKLSLTTCQAYQNLDNQDKLFIFNTHKTQLFFQSYYMQIKLHAIEPLFLTFLNENFFIQSHINADYEHSKILEHIPLLNKYATYSFLDGKVLVESQHLKDIITYYFKPNLSNINKLNTILENITGQLLNIKSTIDFIVYLQGDIDYDYINNRSELLWKYCMTVDNECSEQSFQFFMANLYLHSKKCGCNLYQNRHNDIKYYYDNFWQYQIVPKEFINIIDSSDGSNFTWNNIIHKRQAALENISKFAQYLYLQNTIPTNKKIQHNKKKL